MKISCSEAQCFFLFSLPHAWRGITIVGGRGLLGGSVGVTAVDIQGSGGWEDGSIADGRDGRVVEGIVGRWRKCRWSGWVGGSFERWSGQGRRGAGGREGEG